MRRLLPALVLTLAALLTAGQVLGLRCNLTGSAPRGVYALGQGEPRRGDFVSVCLPDAWAALALARGYLREGSCPNGAQPLLKRLAGAPGDVVSLSLEGVRINGELWPASAPRGQDRSGRTISSALQEGVIPPGQGLVLCEHPGGFDGRYFGLLPLGAMTRAEPLLLLPQEVKHGRDETRSS